MGIVPVFCIVPTCLFGSLYHEAIVTSFLYSVSYRAHSGAIVAVFASGLSVAQDRGKKVLHRMATSRHKLSIKVFMV